MRDLNWNDSGIVSLDAEKITAAGEMLTQSLYDDALAVHMFPDSQERRQLIPWHFSAFVRYGCLFGNVLATRGDPVGVAVWLPPGETSMTDDRVVAAGT